MLWKYAKKAQKTYLKWDGAVVQLIVKTDSTRNQGYLYRFLEAKEKMSKWR